MLSQDFPILCKGRDENGNEVLNEAQRVFVRVYQNDSVRTMISSEVDCPYNTGGHGQRCKASHPKGVDKVGDGVNCPYAFDIPYALEKKK